MKRKSNKKFQYRLILIGSFCVIVGIIITGLGILLISTQSINRVSEEVGEKLIKQVQLNIDNDIEQIESLIFGIELDNQVIEILEKGKSTPVADLEDGRTVENKLMQVDYLRNDIKGIYLLRKDGTAFYNESSPSLVRNYSIDQEVWYDQLQQQGKIIIGKHHPDRYLNNDSEVISYIKTIRTWKNREYLGTIIVDMDPSIFENIFRNLELDSNQQVLILDAAGNIMYDSGSGSLYDAVRHKIKYQENEQFEVSTDLAKYNVYSVKSDKTGWYIVGCMNTLEMTKNTEKVRNATVLIVILMVMVTVGVLSLLISKKFRLIEKLKEGMIEIRKGNYDIHVQGSRSDEIGELCDVFNSMCSRLNYLINTVETLEKEKKEIQLKKVKEELNFLQAQINPHFIYNTLESISMMAELNNDEDAQLMSSSLGRLLRISINRGQEAVAVKEELEHVKCYLAIQKIRYEERFEAEYDVQKEIMQYKIPKLILQPLVENAIYHGIEPMSEKGLIKIKGYRTESEIVFEIHDNGLGIDEDRVDKLNAEMSVDEENDIYETRSIGLRNVNRRIKLYYGDNKYGLSIKSEKGKGTDVIVTLPLEGGEKDGRSNS